MNREELLVEAGLTVLRVVGADPNASARSGLGEYAAEQAKKFVDYLLPPVAQQAVLTPPTQAVVPVVSAPPPPPPSRTPISDIVDPPAPPAAPAPPDIPAAGPIAPPAPSEEFKCQYCGLVCRSKAGLVRHVNVCPRKTTAPAAPLPPAPPIAGTPPAPPTPPAAPVGSVAPPPPPAVPQVAPPTGKFTAPEGSPACYGREHQENTDKCLVCPWEVGCASAQGS